jgi:hypothetical protein
MDILTKNFKAFCLFWEICIPKEQPDITLTRFKVILNLLNSDLKCSAEHFMATRL